MKKYSLELTEYELRSLESHLIDMSYDDDIVHSDYQFLRSMVLKIKGLLGGKK